VWRDSAGVALPRAEALGFLAAAPLNVARITVWHAMASDTPALVATLCLHACHGFLTHLHFLEDTYHGISEDEYFGERHTLTHESSLELLAATGGLRHVRSLQVAGECWPVIDAVRRTVRRLGVALLTAVRRRIGVRIAVGDHNQLRPSCHVVAVARAQYRGCRL
jgi:hypothetical protein